MKNNTEAKNKMEVVMAESVSKEKEALRLLDDIFNCPYVCEARDDSTHDCHEIVNNQKQDGFQKPEPWSGNIHESPLLFIWSSPGINPSEEYPTDDWKKDRIFDFFMNRFDKDKKWVDNNHVLLKNGEHHKEYQHTWASTCKQAERLLVPKSSFGINFYYQHDSL